MDARKGARKNNHKSIVLRWQNDEKVSRISETSWMDRRILPIPGQPHDDRHLLQFTPAPAAPLRTHHHAMMIIGKLDRCERENIKCTAQTLTSLGQEQGRQNSYIPKNERVRQRPFDEALRADLERQSQNWKTYWSQTSSSSSSQQWWQHEHQDTQWSEHQDTHSKPHRICFTDFAYRHWRMSTSSHAHVSQCRAHLTITRTCVWLKAQDLTSQMFGTCCTSAHMFDRPLHDVPDPFPSFCSTPPPSTPTALPMTGIRRRPSPAPLRTEDCCLATWLNPLLAHISSCEEQPTALAAYHATSSSEGVHSCDVYLFVSSLVWRKYWHFRER